MVDDYLITNGDGLNRTSYDHQQQGRIAWTYNMDVQQGRITWTYNKDV